MQVTIITCVTYSALIWDTEGAAAFLVAVSFSMVDISSSYSDDCQKKNEIGYRIKVTTANATREQDLNLANVICTELMP